MPLWAHRATWALTILFSSALSAPQAAEPRSKLFLELRWRHEYLDTLSADNRRDPEYDFGGLRLRFGIDLARPNFSVHARVQAAAAYSLPETAASGIGRSYFEASGGVDRSPTQLRLAELFVRLKPSAASALRVGRIGLQDGAETLSGEPRFDWIKRTRLSERLVGNWDWVHIGRRYDGAALELNGAGWNLFGFGARVLQGGIDYDDGFEQLDGVDVGGLAFTSKRGSWLASTELRLFNLIYRDARRSTETGLGDRMLLDTLGASLVGIYPAGRGAVDLMLWTAYQFGDYGAQTQRAHAFIVETGYGWPTAPGSPWLRAGLARASGDGTPNDADHHTFFNLVPTNHKFYGYQDLLAFQNLLNLYVQFRIQPSSKLDISADAHLFRLNEGADAWYAGSGPANNAALGYVAWRPPGGQPLELDIGTELDLTVDWKGGPHYGLQVGLSHFGGGAAARTLFPIRSDSNWAYVQATLSF